MTKPMVRIHNLETDEVVDREMTDEEYEKHQLEIETNMALKAEAEAKAQAKAALLERLGLTQEEFNTLIA